MCRACHAVPWPLPSPGAGDKALAKAAKWWAKNGGGEAGSKRTRREEAAAADEETPARLDVGSLVTPQQVGGSDVHSGVRAALSSVSRCLADGDNEEVRRLRTRALACA